MKIDIDGIEAFIEEADKYLQIDDINGADLSRVWRKVKIAYADYDKWFCYHNCEIPIDLLAEIGALLRDDSIEMRMNFKKFDYSETLGVTRVTEEDFDEFAVYHDKRNPEIYWTSERIIRNLSRWGIFTLRADNRITAYILLAIGNSNQSEIFCVDVTDRVQCETLMKFAVNFAFDNGKKEVLYMADEHTISQNAAISIGFTVTGFYKGYMLQRAE